MAENLGAIRYEIDINTANMLRGEAAIDKSISGIVKDFDRADKAVRDFEESQRKLGRTINAMGQVLDKNGDVLAGLSNEYRQLAKTADTSFQNVNTRVNGVAQAVNGQLNQALTNTSYQIQDIAVQLAGGQNPFLVMAQQIPQLLVGFGALAAGIGAAVAVLGGLYLAFGDSASNAEKLEKAIEQVKAVMTVGADGVANYSDELKELNHVSENLTKIKLAIALTDNQKALSGIKSEFADLRSSLFNFQEDSDEAAKRLTGLTDKAPDVLGLASALQSLTKVTDNDTKLSLLDKIEERLLSLRSADGAFPTSDLKSFAEEFFTLSKNMRQAIEQQNLLKQSQDGLSGSSENTGEAFEQMRVALKTQRIEMKRGELQAFRYALLMSGDYTAAQIEALVAAKKNNIALREQRKEAKKTGKAMQDLSKDLDAFFAKESGDSTKQDQQQTATLTRQVQTIGLTPEQEIQARYDRELEILRQHKEKVNDINIDYAEREKVIEQDRMNAIKNLSNEMELVNWESFGNRASGALASVALGFTDGKDAARQLFASLLQEGLGALIQYGAKQALISAGFISQKAAETAAVTGAVGAQTAATTAGIAAQSGAAIAATAATTSASVASGAAITAAMAPAAAATSVATAGAAPAAAAGISLSTIGLIIGALVGGRALAGSREFGGPVSAGSMYRVGEKGNPEFFKNKKNELGFIPGENGEIIPADKLMGGGVNWSINVENYGPDKAYATIDDVNKTVSVRIGREVAGMRDGTSQFGKAMKASGNYKNRASS